MNKIFFTDIDSTLIPYCGTISSRTYDAVLRMLADGNKFVLSSGRSISSMMSVVDRCGLMLNNCYAICYNGAQFVDLSSGKRYFNFAIRKEYTDIVVSEARSCNFSILMYEDKGVVAETQSEYIINRYKKQGVGFRLANLMNDMNVNRLKMVISADGETANRELRAFRQRVLAKAGDVLDLYFSSDTYLEVVVKGVNKGSALKMVCNYLGYDISSSIAAGDEENDLEMIKAAGVGCAVANAVPSVKAAAAFVTQNDCEHDGIIEIIDKFVIS